MAESMNYPSRKFSSSLRYLPDFNTKDVVRLVDQFSITETTKHDKGYKFFFENYLYDYEVSNVVNGQVVVRARCYRSMRKREAPHKLEITFQGAAEPALTSFTCSCAAGKALCNHVVAMLYQTAHYKQMKLDCVPPPLACTSKLQQWHRPRTEGIHPEPVDQLLVVKPKSSGKTGRRAVTSTLYKVYLGKLPDSSLLSSGAALSQIVPKPLMADILSGMSDISLAPSQFGQVPYGCILSYQCPQPPSLGLIKHPQAPAFPDIPLQHPSLESNFSFVPTLPQSLHLDSLKVTWDLSYAIEADTRAQSKSSLWKAVRKPRVTASYFREACHVTSEKTAASLAKRIITGSKATTHMKRGLQMEPIVLQQYTDMAGVNVYPCGFVVRPEAPHLGASPDGRVFDPKVKPPFGLVEVKCSIKDNIGEAEHINMLDGKARLKTSHKYYSQVQGQLAISGLNWCDFVTHTSADLSIERIWRDEHFITEMKDMLDLYYLDYMNIYIA